MRGREKVCVCVCWYIMSEFNQKNENKGRRESKKERLLNFSTLFEEERSKRCRIGKKEDNKMCVTIVRGRRKENFLFLSLTRRGDSATFVGSEDIFLRRRDIFLHSCLGDFETNGFFPCAFLSLSLSLSSFSFVKQHNGCCCC